MCGFMNFTSSRLLHLFFPIPTLCALHAIHERGGLCFFFGMPHFVAGFYSIKSLCELFAGAPELLIVVFMGFER
jgi:hypothetical protein